MTEHLPETSAAFGGSGSNAALVTFLVYMIAVFAVAWFSNRLLKKRAFLSEYFLGSRSLGVWAFALTFAATHASGGSFTGCPSKIYMHGWVGGLWLGSYIVVPICAMGFLGKRLNHVARISGAITIPDVMRDRFHSARLGLLATLLLVFFMSFNLVSQFKAAGEILKILLKDVGLFQTGVGWLTSATTSASFFNAVDPAYLLCLLTFAVTVIVYTTFGGFRAVVWTDVLQGLVMVTGVLIMLPLAITQSGGLENATHKIARMTPPRLGLARLEIDAPPFEDFSISSPWFTLPGEDGSLPRLFRISGTLVIPANQTSVEDLRVVELTTPEEIRQQLQRLEQPRQIDSMIEKLTELGRKQIASYGQPASSRPADAAAQQEIQRLVEWIDGLKNRRIALFCSPDSNGIRVSIVLLREYEFGSGQPGVYATGPGPWPPSLSQKADTGVFAAGSSASVSPGFLPLSLAISFFFMWAISGSGQPGSMVRLMAFKNTATLRRGIFVVSIYYSMIYFPLVVIFCCARVLLPGRDLESDSIMPQMAVALTANAGQPWLAGLVMAAPFAAVMSTVDSFLLMISSALVRDIYQRNINPEVSERAVRRLCYLFTLLAGTGAMLGAVNPPQFLQDIIIYTGSGLAACFLAPMVFGLYWPRANCIGCMSGMAAGFVAHLGMYVAGLFVNGSFFQPYLLFNCDPILVGLFVSFGTVYVVTRLTPPPPEALVRKFFYV